jgi:tight adherence protein B
MEQPSVSAVVLCVVLVIAAAALLRGGASQYASGALRRRLSGSPSGGGVESSPVGAVAVDRRSPNEVTLRWKRTGINDDERVAQIARKLSGRLRAGDAITTAWVSVLNTADGEDSRWVERLRAGEHLERVLWQWQAQRGNTALGPLVSMTELCQRLGGDSAVAFDRCAELAELRIDASRELRALSAQSRASAALLTGLPPLVSVGLAAVDPAVGEVLTSSVGVVCVALAVTLDLAGLAWMRRLAAAPW